MFKGDSNTTKNCNLLDSFLLHGMLFFNIRRSITMFLVQNSFCLNDGQEPHLFLRFIICIFSNLEESSAQ